MCVRLRGRRMRRVTAYGVVSSCDARVGMMEEKIESERSVEKRNRIFVCKNMQTNCP